MANFPNSNHVRFLGLEDASDLLIFQTARKLDFSLITFDSDFIDLNILYGSPPKIIWLRTGNLTTNSITQILLRNFELIQEFLNSAEQEVIEIFG